MTAHMLLYYYGPSSVWGGVQCFVLSAIGDRRFQHCNNDDDNNNNNNINKTNNNARRYT